MHQYSWRKNFIELSEGIFRSLGFPPPEMHHEESLPLAMELEIEGIPFELLHSSTEQSHRILISFSLGEIPEESEQLGMIKLMKTNLKLARAHQAAYGIGTEKKEIRCMYYEDLDGILPDIVLSTMRQKSRDALIWKNDFFSKVTSNINISSVQSNYTLA